MKPFVFDSASVDPLDIGRLDQMEFILISWKSFQNTPKAEIRQNQADTPEKHGFPMVNELLHRSKYQNSFWYCIVRAAESLINVPKILSGGRVLAGTPPSERKVVLMIEMVTVFFFLSFFFNFFLFFCHLFTFLIFFLLLISLLFSFLIFCFHFFYLLIFSFHIDKKNKAPT